MLTLVLLSILVFLACAVMAWCRRNPNKDEPPAMSGALPLIGHSYILIGDSAKLWTNLKTVCYESLKAGGVLCTFLGPRTVYFITDPNDYLKVANACLEKDKFYDFGKAWVGNGLITSEASLWKLHRKRINSAFNQIVLDGFLELFNTQARQMVKALEAEVGKGPFDHFLYTRYNALETICLTSHGIDVTDKKELFSDYVTAVKEMWNVIITRVQKVWLHSDLIFNLSELKRKQDKCLKTLHNMSNTVLRQRKEIYLNNRQCKEIDEEIRGPIFKPFIDLLLELSIENGFFTTQEIRDHIDTMIGAGHDTVAGALMYTMLLVSSYPDVQDKIFDELHKVFQDEERDVTKQDLSQLVYLEAVLKESMRIYPPVPFVLRRPDSDIKLRNCTISKGRSCILFSFGVHRHPMWGPDAEQFRPDRWLDSTTLALQENTIPFAAFSMGRRNCIGQSFAYMSMKTTLAHVFRHYKLTGDHTKLVAKVDVLLKPVSGHHITIEKRKA